MKQIILFLAANLLLLSCSDSKSDGTELPKPIEKKLYHKSFTLDGKIGSTFETSNLAPEIIIEFTLPIDKSTISGIKLELKTSSQKVPIEIHYETDSTLVIKPKNKLDFLSTYRFYIEASLTSTTEEKLESKIDFEIFTGIDNENKFPLITDNELLTLIQKQTFKYFWDFGHPVSGMARERASSGDLVTSGGTGFGIMAIPVAVERGFITKPEALIRLQTMVSFLKNKADRFHGAYSHWMDGATGKVIPFGVKDNGADVVETSFLVMGLLTARQYFDGSTADEIKLRNDINEIYRGIEWNKFRKDDGNSLYWNWSPDLGFAIDLKITGWNESLVTYLIAASSESHPIPVEVYNEGWTNSGKFINGKSFYGHQLPLGPDYGGPLFMSHYSFLGINPKNLKDKYTNYWEQVVNHSLINRAHCIDNPNKHRGYGAHCWGLSASDIQDGYTASSPTNDRGFIAPTAAISSIAYTPEESMDAIRFFYYKLGDKLWGEYGFQDSFSLNNSWYSSSFLAIDQAPQIVMIENHRTGLVWNLFMSCPEIKAGLAKLEFSY